MVTTIQIPIDLKKDLDSLKKEKKMTYAQIIEKLIASEKKRQNELLLREYGKKYGVESVKEVREWNSTEPDWEYNDETR